ncbi:uncharacterized protein LOC110397144 [Numida meleagris]|uniref:uncharacterized protein LOC110397144 n=1 Tax=Numida meleagris TaxID=8996 RepID=UPI000B3DC702|nr:uncharacterized protein LOC110397144 [Numida meleagris]
MATRITKEATTNLGQGKAGCHFACELTGERSLTAWLSLRITSMAAFWGMSFFLSLKNYSIFYRILWNVLIISLVEFIMDLWNRRGGRPRRYRCRGNVENHRVVDLHNASQCSRTHCFPILEREDAREARCQLDRSLEEFHRRLEMSIIEMSEDSLRSNQAVETHSSPETSLSSWSDNSLTPIEEMGAGCSSRASLSSLSNNSLAAVVATEADCTLSAPLPPPREGSCTYVKADEGSCISQLSLITPLHGADLGHAAVAQPDLMLSDALEPQKVQETLAHVEPQRKPEEEVGLPACGEGTLQEISSPQKPQQPSELDVEVVPRVPKPLFLDEAVKRQLERHMVKMQIQRCFGLPEKVLASYKKFSEPVWELQDCQPPPQRHTVLPYRSPFQRWDSRARIRKTAVQPPGPQQESTAPVETCTQGTQTPVHSVPAAFVRVAKEVPCEDLDKLPLKRKYGGTVRSSNPARKKTLPGSRTKEQGPGTKGGDPGSSFYIQEEQTVPQREGAPQQKAGQDDETTTLTTGVNTGVPEPSQCRTAPSGNNSLQIEDSSTKDTPIDLPPPPRPAGNSLQMPSLEEMLRALTDLVRVSTMAEHLQNQLLASWLEESQDNAGHPRLAAEHPIAAPCRAQKAAQKGEGLRQHQISSRRLYPKCSKAPCHSVPCSEGMCTSAPAVAGVPGTVGGEVTVGEKNLAGEGPRREQGQKQTAAAAQQPEGVRVYQYVVAIPAVKQRTNLSQQTPTRTLPSQTEHLPKCASATPRSPAPETSPQPSCCCGCLIPILLCLQKAWAKLLGAGKALYSKIW